MATSGTQELDFFEPVFFGDLAAARTSLTGVMGRNAQQNAAVPSHFVHQLPSELAPALIEDGAVQTRLLTDPFAVLFAIAFTQARKTWTYCRPANPQYRRARGFG